jgi:hypothetical protein
MRGKHQKRRLPRMGAILSRGLRRCLSFDLYLGFGKQKQDCHLLMILAKDKSEPRRVTDPQIESHRNES